MAKDKDSKEPDFMKMVDELIGEIFADRLKDEEEEKKVSESVEEYTQRTGKRFRMTKDQKDRELSRQQAFAEFIEESGDE